MVTNNANPHKTRGNERRTGLQDKPATIYLVTGETIDADHHFTSKCGALVHAVIDRDETPAGIDVSIPVERVAAIQRSDRVAVARAARAALDVDAGDESRVDMDERTEAVTDGGCDLACTCGADLIETAELIKDRAPVAGARGPSPWTRPVPSAECGACGACVGNLHGMDGVVALWDARGETLPGGDE